MLESFEFYVPQTSTSDRPMRSVKVVENGSNEGLQIDEEIWR